MVLHGIIFESPYHGVFHRNSTGKQKKNLNAMNQLTFMDNIVLI
jgi:hypothetical protein